MGLVVVGASENIARIARTLDDDVVFVDALGSGRRRASQDDGGRSFAVDWQDEAALTEFAQRVLAPLAPRAVVSVTEHGLVPAALLSGVLGALGVPVDVVRATRDKRLMRRVLAAKAPHLTVDHADARDEAAVADLLSRCGRAVVKPADGTASTDVCVVRSLKEFRRVSDPEGLIVEEFAEGTEFSVESFSVDGRHEVIGIAEKGTAEGFVEVSHVMSGDPPAEQQRLIGRAVGELLDALGLTDGPAHTEVKVHGDTVKVIETHNRPGGDSVADLVAIVTGIDWRKVCLGWPLGLRPAASTPHAPAAASVFFTAPPGRVTAVRADAPEWADVTVEYWKVEASVGDLVGELRSSSDRLGMAVLSGRSADACRAAVRALRERPVVVTEPGGTADVGPELMEE
ncbi:ATP-grasp domain-containing protein [Streptomyces heilongjiangensis]|uniref:ATP-grasp domain-containing protein n=1 Tax=Streptomyces heilongjiangensis TaxID=945052 RepID=A0ABW1BJZ5_9ACTN|nr:ATP-grasp domain-containing protein [Streptomyces heilongjiangensis]MDC2952110.1 ATP-grasp domain-containing protein [Streptomyces heilongjiangensis]